MNEYRVYIDESGDHTYKNVADTARRFLGLTAVVINKGYYSSTVVPTLEALKRSHFTYDLDHPPILVRSRIIRRKGAFGVLNERARNDSWETDLLAYFRALDMQVFSVVIDKHKHYERFGNDAWNPYHYSLNVLLGRVRGWLRWSGRKWVADVMPESRGRREDKQLQDAYDQLRQRGDNWRTASEICEAFPNPKLLIRRKEFNVAGLQVVDLLAAGLKTDICSGNGKPVSGKPGKFDRLLVQAIKPKINRYGRYLLE